MFFICIMLILFISSFNLLLSMLIEKSINISLVYEEGNIFGCLLLMLITVVLYFILLFIKMNLQVVICENKK